MLHLESLSTEEREILDGYLESVIFAEGDCILKEGETGDCCYLIDEGRVRLELLNVHTDSDTVLGFLDPGAILGEFSVIDQEVRSASAFADTEVKARKLTAQATKEGALARSATSDALAFSSTRSSPRAKAVWSQPTTMRSGSEHSCTTM